MKEFKVGKHIMKKSPKHNTIWSWSISTLQNKICLNHFETYKTLTLKHRFKQNIVHPGYKER
jgi:hypothetical protein